MSNRKSMVQIAQDLGVTRQTIYNRLKSKELAEAVKPFTIVEGCNKFYDIQAQELIKQAVLKDSLKVSKLPKKTLTRQSKPFQNCNRII